MKVKKHSINEKQRKEFIQGMARFLFNTLKGHLTSSK